MDLEAHEENEAKPLLGSRMATDKFNHRALVKGQQAAADPTPKEFNWRLLTLIPVQQILFMAMLFVVVKLWYGFPLLVLLSAFAALVKSYLVMKLYSGEKWKSWVGRTMLLATCLGLLAGWAIYYRSMVLYFHYRDAARYTNVVASQAAYSVRDAGVVSFAAGSVVDSARSVGYQSAIDGMTVCVAPVVDASMTPGTPVNFYAFGVNCCAHRANFRCDDALDPAARSGMIRAETTDLVPPLLSAFAAGPSDEGLQAAVQLQQALYGGPSHGKNLFLSVVKDPIAAQMSFIDSSIMSALKLSGYFLLFQCFAACVIGMGPERFGKLARSTYR